MKNKLIIIGTGITAKQMYYNFKNNTNYEIIGFTIDKKYIIENTHLDLPVYPLEEIQKYCDFKNTDFFIAISWNRLNQDRTFMYNRLVKEGISFANCNSKTSMIQSNVKIGDNCWVSDGAIIEAFSEIGNNTFVKSGAWIAHNTIIGNNCFIGAKSIIAGEVVIGDDTFIGIGATIFDQVEIGKKCLIGARTIIKRNIPNYSLVKALTNNQEVKQFEHDTIEQKLLAKKNIR